MNPNEARQNAYLQLVQALLNCPSDDEDLLLASNPALVDMGLVMTLLAVAQRMMEQDDPQVSAIEWLVEYAQQLAQKLGMDMGESPAEDDEEYAGFVLNLLQTVNNSDGEEATVHAFLEEHLTYLNEHLLAIFPQQIDRLFALKSESEWKLFIASDIHNLAVDLGEFTSGNRSINLELAIACYDRALSVYTQSDFPEDWARTQNNLANTYRDRIEGDRIANLELAIQAYQSALEVRTPRKYPIESGRIQADLEATIELRDTLTQSDRHHPEFYESEVKTSTLKEDAQFTRTQLIQALLECPGGEKNRLLAAHPELVDEELVMAALAEAQMIAERNDPAAASTIQWLLKFAQQLADYLGLDTANDTDSDREESNQFSLELLQSVVDSNGDGRIVNQFLDEHLRYLNENLLAIFPQHAERLLARKDESNWKSFVASTLSILAGNLYQFPRGNRAINLELAIACYTAALTVYTLSAFPADWAMTQNNLAAAYIDRIRGERAENIELGISYCSAALTVHTPSAFPEGWAMTQHNLANAYSQRIKGERAENIELAISSYTAALMVRTPSAFPEGWAMTQHNLANAYSDRIRGERGQNIELAISCYTATLTVNTPSAFPEGWAMTQNSLANAYSNRIRGERAANLELSINYYRLALDVYTRAVFPADWAMTQMNLANAYSNRIRGERAANLELSIDYYRLALDVYTRAAFPADWAMTQMNLANAYSNRIRGERAANLEKSIECYMLALEVYTREAFPKQWAMTQMNLATAYSDRIRGERAANLELSIEYMLALEIRTREADPEDWAGTQMNLAKAYSDRIRGERAANLEESIKCYMLALEVYTRAAYPEKWAMTQMSLALAYGSRIQGERAANLEKSIDSCRLALEVYTREAFPEQWAMTQMNLAVAYQHRIRGERAANLELSIDSYQLALEVRNRAAFPEDWARTQMNLATAYQHRIRGERAANLEESIKCYMLALEVYTRAAYPEKWAMTQMNLATAYSDRIRGERAANLEKSIDSYRLALDIYTREAFPEDWARTQMNLAVAYQHRIRGERAANLEKSIDSYQLALEVRTREAFPEDWARTQMNLATAYQHRIRGKRAANLELSIECSRLALEIYTREAYPEDCLQTARNLGNLHYEIGNWKPAIDAYETAMQAVETSRSWALNDESRQELSKNALSIYENAIQCAINLQNYSQAIQFTERIRSRSLVELMESKDLYADAQLPPEIATYLTEYQDINHQIQSIRQQPDSFGDKAAAITTLERQKAATYDKLRKLDPVLAGEIKVTAIDYASIQTLITTPHTAILSCYTTDDDTHIFIIKHQGEPTIHTCKGQGKKEFQQWLQTEWIDSDHTEKSPWRSNLPESLHDISKRLQLNTLIAEHLTDISELIIVPHLNLHQIPFAALPIKGTEELLSDKFIIRSIPSCQILQYCNDRPTIETAIIGTVEDADDTVLGARYEGAQIAALYNIPSTNRLIGSSQATPANYRALLSRVNRLHSSHHATSRPDNPLESALILAQGERITLSDLLIERYPNLDEVFLSACETHVGTANITDDIATLTTGFLCIGARSVQSTLWAVNDIVTVVFSLFYHQQRKQGKNRVISLQTAQKQLRNLTGEQFAAYHPRIIEYFTTHSPAMISSLNDRIAKLIKQQSMLDLDTQKGEWDELQANINKLSKDVKLIEVIPWDSEDYCELDRPFKDPYFWAAFITQGMA
jgi:CHAT domain-containing protein/predicted LPLAT superfamily acyltransferase